MNSVFDEIMRTDCDSSEDDKIKISNAYIKYERIWKRFADLCETNNIVARSDWTCCRTCGHAEIYDERKDLEKSINKKYLAYVFYHEQEADCIYNQCEQNKNPIKVWLGWHYFDEDDFSNDTGCVELAKKIKKIAIDAGCDLEYTDIKQNLSLVVTV